MRSIRELCAKACFSPSNSILPVAEACPGGRLEVVPHSMQRTPSVVTREALFLHPPPQPASTHSAPAECVESDILANMRKMSSMFESEAISFLGWYTWAVCPRCAVVKTPGDGGSGGLVLFFCSSPCGFGVCCYYLDFGPPEPQTGRQVGDPPLHFFSGFVFSIDPN